MNNADLKFIKETSDLIKSSDVLRKIQFLELEDGEGIEVVIPNEGINDIGQISDVTVADIYTNGVIDPNIISNALITSLVYLPAIFDENKKNKRLLQNIELQIRKYIDFFGFYDDSIDFSRETKNLLRLFIKILSELNNLVEAVQKDENN